ncbi:hypothetical protein, partial [Clostridioides difficile]|uniref:hypothetical protein n=1 Tax=Clostridioides difficile TaxID=1496 RepID=UPI001A9A718C
ASATPGCAHAQIEGKDRRSAPETFSAVLGQTRDHYNKFCGLPNQSVPATVALFQQSYSDCGSSAERAQVTELGRGIDRRRTELCRSLRETLTRADDFCKS